MFADAAKDPIPAALQLNEINISTTLAMLGVGLKPEFAFGFNFLPGIREASKQVQQAQFAISEDSSQEYVFYNNAVQTQLEELEKNNPGLIGSLKAAGIMNPLTSLRNAELYKSKIKIEFDPKKIEMENLDNLTPSQIGFKVSTTKGIDLTDAQAEAVLMMYYWEQSKQTFAINRVANMTNLFKRLNPSLAAFDKQRDGMEKIQSGELFSNADVLFKDEFSVFKILQLGLEDAADQFSKILIERSAFFQNVSEQFGKYFKEPKIFANVITSYIGLRKFVKTFPGSRDASNDTMKNFFEEDDAILQKSFTPEYWFTNSLEKELEELQAANPKNEFLRLLRVEESDKTAVVNFEGKDYEVAERYLKILSRAKIKGDFANTISDDIYALYKGKANESMFVRKLFYHELVRTGMMPKAGSFFQFMPVELLLPISNNIDSFINYMKDATTEDINNFEGFMSEFLGGGSKSDTFEFFDELFNQIAYAAATEKGNDKIPRFKSGSGKNRSYTELKISTGKESDKFKYATQALYNFVDTKSKSIDSITMDDMLDAKEKMITKLLDIFGKEYEESVKIRDLESVNIVDLAGDEFTMDLSSDKSDPASSLSKVFGVKYDAVIEEFEFPRILKIGKKTFILQSTNAFSTKGKSAGEVIVDAFQGKTTFSNLGTSATYKAIPEVYSSDKFSPLAFTSKQAEQYKKYIDRTEKIMYVRPGSTAVTEAATTKPTTSVVERTFKDESLHQAYIKGGLDEVKKVIEQNKKVELNAAKTLSQEVELLDEFEILNAKPDKTNTENDRLIELYVLLKNSKELDFEYSLNQLGLSTQPAAPKTSKVVVETVEKYTNADVKANPNKIYVFGDNLQRTGTGGQAQIRNNPNAFGIVTKLKPTMNDDAFMSDNDLDMNRQNIDSDIRKIKAQNKTVVFPKDGLGTGLAKLKEKAPKTYEYLKQRLQDEFGFDNEGKVTKQKPTISNLNAFNKDLEPKNDYTIQNNEYAPSVGEFIDVIKNNKPVQYEILEISDKGILVKNTDTNVTKLFPSEEDFMKAFKLEKNAGFDVLGSNGLALVYVYGKLSDGRTVYTLDINLYNDESMGKGLGKDIYKAALKEIHSRNGVLTPGAVVEGNKVWESFKRDNLIENATLTTGETIVIAKTAEPTTNVEEVDDDEMIGGTFVDANMLNAILGLKNGTTNTSEDEDNDSEDPLKC
jgi:hypothetical protein